MKSSRKIKLDTYNCEVTFTVTDKLQSEFKKIYKKFNIKHDDNDGSESEGVVLTPDIDKYFLIIDSNYLTHNTLAHEIYHVVVRVTEDRDIVDEEAQAWLAGHITGVIYKFLRTKKFQIKHGG